MISIKGFLRDFLFFVMLFSPIEISALQAELPHHFITGTFKPSLLLTDVCGEIVHIQGVTMRGTLLSITIVELEKTPFYQSEVSQIITFLKKTEQTPKIIKVKRGRCI